MSYFFQKNRCQPWQHCVPHSTSQFFFHRKKDVITVRFVHHIKMREKPFFAYKNRCHNCQLCASHWNEEKAFFYGEIPLSPLCSLLNVLCYKKGLFSKKKTAVTTVSIVILMLIWKNSIFFTKKPLSSLSALCISSEWGKIHIFAEKKPAVTTVSIVHLI